MGADREVDRDIDLLGPFRQFLTLRRDVLVLSVAMLAFSLAFQMTGRYVPEYLRVLGAGAGVVGLYGSLGNLIGALYPYPGGALSDRIGSRYALTLFGTVTTIGFVFWAAAPLLPGLVFPTETLTLPVVGEIVLGGTVGPWIWVVAGLFLTQAWKSFGLGATFAVVKQATDPGHLALGFASTEVFRRAGFLLGPAIAAVVLAVVSSFVLGFQYVLLIAIAFGVLGTLAQHVLYDASEDTIGATFRGIEQVRTDLRDLPDPLRPLLVADTLIRFANGIVYVFFVLVVVDRGVGVSGFGVVLGPAAYFGVLLVVEMVVALVSMPPVAKLAEYTGLKPVVAIGFGVYAIFPVLLIFAPADPLVYLVLFAFSGLRFAGLPAHKALIVGPAERDTGGRVTGTYYLVRNTVVIPSAAIGGWLYGSDWAVQVGAFVLTAGPELAFTLASFIGLVGVGYFVIYGVEFAPYARPTED